METENLELIVETDSLYSDTGREITGWIGENKFVWSTPYGMKIRGDHTPEEQESAEKQIRKYLGF